MVECDCELVALSEFCERKGLHFQLINQRIGRGWSLDRAISTTTAGRGIAPMVILGLDVATCTGWALYEPGSSLSSIKTGLIKADGDNAKEKSASLAQQMVAKSKAGRPDFVAIEQPMRSSSPACPTRPLLSSRPIAFLGRRSRHRTGESISSAWGAPPASTGRCGSDLWRIAGDCRLAGMAE